MKMLISGVARYNTKIQKSLMKVYRDLSQIQRKDKWGKRFSMTGLAILFIGLLSSFVPTWYPPDVPGTTELIRFMQANWSRVSFVALPLGFVSASIGSYFINRFSRRRWTGNKQLERPDEVFQRTLKGMDDKYAYYSFALPAAYVVAGPCGVLIFAARSDKGRVTVNGDRWREPLSIGRMLTLFAREGLGNPGRDLETQQQKMRELLESVDEESDNKVSLADVPIAGAAVFLNPDIQLEVENPSVPALRADQVKNFIRGKTKEVQLPNQTVRELLKALSENCVVSEGMQQL